MKPEDLMIGNWVKYNPNVFVDDEYETPKPIFYHRIMNGEDIDLAIEDCYIPIKITETILIMLGFKRERNDFIGVNNRVTLTCDSPMNSDNTWYVHVDNVDYDTIKRCELTYLHELQNELHQCGIDLDIDLTQLNN